MPYREIEAKVDALRSEFDPLVMRVVDVEKTLQRLPVVEEKVGSLDLQVAAFASALTACAQAAANAANTALDAKQSQVAFRDEVTKMIASALSIQKGTIESTIASAVTGAVTAALEPVRGEVDSLKKNDAAQNGAMVVVARALGVEKQLDKDLVSATPVEPGASSGTLKHSRIVQSIIAIGLLAKVIYDFVAPHH
jgi:hypothetical protein